MLSVVITAWNEEKNLPRVVASVKKIADEIVVVDTQSSDNTFEVAKKLGCKVFKHDNTGVVEPVRNFSISKAQGDWILLLDADEELSQDLLEKIKTVIKENKADYYRIPRKNIIFGKWIQSEHWWPDYVYRLFKKGSVVWEDKIHSVPFTKGTGADLPIQENSAIVHHHYETVSQYVDRLNRYTDHQLKHIQADGYNFSWQDLINRPMAEFIRQYFSRRGYRDGLHGLALSGLQAFSEMVLYLKLWQESAFLVKDVTPAQIDQALAAKASEYKWWLIESRINTSPFWQKPFWKLWRKLA
jgi:(heptosyl)LPS beta-1,4-glucosyltransferase